MRHTTLCGAQSSDQCPTHNGVSQSSDAQSSDKCLTHEGVSADDVSDAVHYSVRRPCPTLQLLRHADRVRARD